MLYLFLPVLSLGEQSQLKKLLGFAQPFYDLNPTVESLNRGSRLSDPAGDEERATVCPHLEKHGGGRPVGSLNICHPLKEKTSTGY